MDRKRALDAFGLAAVVLSSLVFVLSIPASVALRGSPADAIDPNPGVAGTARASILVRRAADGAPIPSATVRAFWASSDRYYSVGTQRTDREGRALLAKLPAGATWIVVDARGYARRSTALVLGGATRDVVLALEPATSLAVAVADQKSRPVSEATVLVEASDRLPFGALTDGAGRASFSALGKGPFTVHVYARGYEPETKTHVVADVNVALRAACGLDVHVVDSANHDVAGSTVLVAGAGVWPARSLETGKDGHARISGISAGAYDLKATKGTLVSRTEVGAHVDPGAFAAVELKLEEGRMVPLVVTDGEGDHPVVVPNADVLVVEGGVSSFPLQGRSDSFGKVTLGPVASGPVVAAARADGFVERGGIAVPDELKDAVRIPLVRGARLAGDVVDDQGRPIDGARIEVIGTDPDGAPIAETPLAIEFRRAHFAWALKGPAPLVPSGELGVMPGAIPPIPSEGTGVDFAFDRMTLEAENVEPWVTDTNGEFRASPLPPGRVRALVRHPSYVETTSDPVTLGPGGEARVKIVLRPGGAVEGTVVDEAGLPVAGARVDAAAVEGTLTRTARSADDGSFAFATLPSEVQLSLARPGEPGHVVLRRTISVKEGDRIEVELVLPDKREAMSVSVEDDSGKPVKMAQVTALSLDPEHPLRTTEFTDDEGHAKVDDAVGLPIRVVVEAPGFARFAREVTSAPGELPVALAFGVIVEGHVTAVRGRADVEGAAVELVADGHRRVTFTDPLGHFRFADVTPGKVRLVVSHPDYAPGEAEAVVTPTGRPDRAFELDAVDLAEPGIVEGHVVDREGRPVSGARVGVGIVGAYVPVGAASTGTVTTKSDGAFRLDRVHPGDVDIGAYSPDSGRGHAVVTVDGGRTREDVVIRLDTVPADDEPRATGGVAATLVERRQGAAADVVVVEVAPGSEAEHAGLVTGDVLKTIDKASPTSVADARRRLSGPDGSDVVVEVSRTDGPATLRIRREPVRR